jgi:H+-transporting ATPase
VTNLIAASQIIIEEAETVPADAKVVCDYEEKDQGWDRYQRLREEGKLGRKQDSQGEEEEEEDEENNDYPVLSCDHSAITGESLAVDRFAGDDVFYTTGCKRGKAYGIVQATGPKTFVGRTAAMVQGTSGKGHFQIVMDSIGTSLLVLVMAWLLAMWIGGFFRNLPIASPGEQTLLYYTLSLLIIGVPVGLPVVTTTTLAVGAAYLAKKKAIVQKLTAIESLAVSPCIMKSTRVVPLISLLVLLNRTVTDDERAWTFFAQTKQVL